MATGTPRWEGGCGALIKGQQWGPLGERAAVGMPRWEDSCGKPQRAGKEVSPLRVKKKIKKINATFS